MPDIMEEKVAKVFMSIRRLKDIVLSLRWANVVLTGLLGCSPDLSDDPIPYQPFPDIILNLNLPDNIALKTKGASKEISGGIRGIIVYCQEPGIYRAYERNCSYHPNDACATVNIDNSKLFMIDPCCGSSFEFATGNPMGGIAWRPLQKYHTSFNGADLIITDQIVE
jgi:nitrite reductase/ring-hydroxylating ferredoxin subunit